MKKVGFLLAVLSVCAVFLTGCQNTERVAGGDRLYIYNWTTVVYDMYATNEDMYAKLQSGGSGYDIVFPSGDYVSIMMSQDMFAKIDHSKLSNLGNIDPLVLQKATYDHNMEYSVPYYWGAAGVAVNTAKVPEFERNWNIFSREDLKGRMTMLDDMREVMGDALVSLGYSVNSKNQDEINAARDLINTSWKPNLIKFDAEAFGKGFATGDFWVVQGYAEVVYEEIAGNEEMIENTVFFIPEQGGPAYVDSMCILKDSKNIDLAHKFIDFIHRPEIYAEFADFFGFPATVNVPARELQTIIPLYQTADLAATELKEDLGEAIELYNTAWFDSIRIGE